jgi:hypothetical protein
MCCRELFNNVACEAIFSDAGALQLMVDVHALMSVFGRYTPRPQAHFWELRDAVALLNLQQQQADFVKQVRLAVICLRKCVFCLLQRTCGGFAAVIFVLLVHI